MSWQRALNEVQGLLAQGGVPTNHAQDIVARFSLAISDYYDFRESQRNNSAITDSSADSSAFKRAFAPPEANPGGIVGPPGADGLGAYAWAVGKDGEAGQDGTNGDGTTINDYRDYNTYYGGGGGGIDLGRVPCEALKGKLKDCGIKTGEDGKDAKLECPPGGAFPGGPICSILKQQANELGKQRRKLEELEDKIKAIEKQLADTVDCLSLIHI